MIYLLLSVVVALLGTSIVLPDVVNNVLYGRVPPSQRTSPNRLVPVASITLLIFGTLGLYSLRRAGLINPAHIGARLPSTEWGIAGGICSFLGLCLCIFPIFMFHRLVPQSRGFSKEQLKRNNLILGFTRTIGVVLLLIAAASFCLFIGSN